MKRETSKLALVGWCLLAAAGGSVVPAQGGSIFQCTDAEGKVYFTESGCPTGYKGGGVVGDTKNGNTSTQDSPRGRRTEPQPGYAPGGNVRGAQPYAEGGRNYVDPGPSVTEQAAQMEAQKERVRQRQAEEYQRWQAQQGPSYWDEVAARNAMLTIKNERELQKNNNHYAPRNAAEMGIEYNARSVAGGGRHQVRVPDVYETHIQNYGSNSRSCAGPGDSNCVKK